MPSKFATIVLDAEKGVEIAVEDALKFVGVAQKAAPAAVVGLAALGGAIDKALTDVEGATTNPTQLVLNLPTDIADIKAVWPTAKAFLATLGIKI